MKPTKALSHWRAVVLTLVVSLVLPWVALADNTQPDGDGTTPVDRNDLSLGTVCANSTATGTALVAISRQGGYPGTNVFLNGSTVTVSVLSVSGTGLSASVPQPEAITLPDDWGSQSNGTKSASVTSSVKLVAGAAGSFSGLITYRSTGPSSKSGKGIISRDASMRVTANVVQCNTPPHIVVNDVTKEGDTAGGWTLVFGQIGSASDAEDGMPAVSCEPAIGSVLPVTSTVVSCTATDSVGQTASDSGTVTVIDTTPPLLVSMPANLQVEGNAIDGAYVDYTAPTASDLVDPSPTVDCSPASGEYFPLGPTGVTCTAEDASGNSRSQMFVITVVDTTAPILIHMPENMTVEGNTTNGAYVSYTVPTATDIVDPEPEILCDHDPAGAFHPLGDTMVTCTATDDFDNSASGAFIMTVEDTTAPLFVDLPDDMAVEATAPGGANVSYGPVTADDIVDPSPSVVCAPASGTLFPLGVTTVLCTATDASHNVTSGAFDVTVQDTTPPDLHGVPGDMTVEGNTVDGAYVLYPVPTATDIVDPEPTVTCNPVSSSFFALGGPDAVLCTATDALGNSSDATFYVTVVDTTPPDITCPADLTGRPGEPVSLGSPIVSDIVDESPSVANDAPGTFPSGQTIVIWTATDYSGNSAQCSQKVSISYRVFLPLIANN